MTDDQKATALAVSMLKEEMQAVINPFDEQDTKDACNRFTARWTAAANAAIPTVVAEVHGRFINGV